MATIQSLTESFGVLRRNPIVFVGGLLYAVVVFPQSALSAMNIPLAPTVLQIITFFITPFIVAGILGMTYEGRVRGTSLGTFKKIGKKKYVSLLAGNLVIFAITVVFVLAMFLVMFLVLGASFAAAGSESLLGGIGLLTVAVVFGGILAFLLLMFFLQFFAPAIVADNVGVGPGFKRSVAVVKQNLLSTLGFAVLNLVITLALTLPALAITVLPLLTGAGAGVAGATSEVQSTATVGSSLLAQVGLMAYSFVIATVMTPFRLAFSVSFYDNHRPSSWG